MKSIETSDLRIGNIVDYSGRAFLINEIYKESVQGVNIFDESDSGTIPIEEITGIQFTEKLLNKLGWYRADGITFKLSADRVPNSNIKNHLDIEFPYDNAGIRVWMHLKDGYGSAVYLKYLHELQNLFRALHFREI